MSSKPPAAPDIAAAFAAPPPHVIRVPCTVGSLIASMSPEAAAAVNAAFLPDSGWKSTQLANKLRELGYADVKDNNVSRHRRRLNDPPTGEHCECPR